MTESNLQTMTVKVATADGDFDAWMFSQDGGSRPGIVMIPEINGVNASLREIAARYANEGFVVMALDIFWRLEPRVDLDYSEQEMQKARVLHDDFNYETGVADMQAAITTLRHRPECNGKIGVVGFCLGGTMGYLAGSRTDADAAVGYYGTRLGMFLSDGPRISRPTMLHLGRLDHRTPPELMVQIEKAIAGNPQVELFAYDNAVHAFANHHRPKNYNAEITRTADARTFRLFHKALTTN
jgi:carboxymethylenebutenolidase